MQFKSIKNNWKIKTLEKRKLAKRQHERPDSTGNMYLLKGAVSWTYIGLISLTIPSGVYSVFDVLTPNMQYTKAIPIDEFIL